LPLARPKGGTYGILNNLICTNNVKGIGQLGPLPTIMNIHTKAFSTIVPHIIKDDDLEITYLNRKGKGKGFLGYDRMVTLCDFIDLFLDINNNRKPGSKVALNKAKVEKYNSFLTNRLEKYFSTISNEEILNGLPIITYYDKDNTLLGSRTFTNAEKFTNKVKDNATFKSEA
jgi:hypothetical protein